MTRIGTRSSSVAHLAHGSARVNPLQQPARSGLLVVAGDSSPRSLDAALASAPWRGGLSSAERVGSVVVMALGGARVWRRKDLVIAMHGRVDSIEGREMTGEIDQVEEGLSDAVGGDTADCAARVVGDYALVVVRASGRLDALRSWVGTRPLFWARSRARRDVVALASDVAAVVAALGDGRGIDEGTLDAFSRYADPDDPYATFIDGVTAVPPSGRVILRGAETTREVTPPSPERRVLARDQAAEALRGALERAVLRRTAGSRVAAGELSGGMDSSSVMATTVRLARRGRAPTPFAITNRFPDASDCDEVEFARQTTDLLGIDLEVVDVASGAVTRWYSESPAIHGPTHPTSFLSAGTVAVAARRGADTLLTGQGGDSVVEPASTEVEAMLGGGQPVAAARWLIHYLLREPRYALHSVKAAATRRLGLRPRRDTALASLPADWWMRQMMEFEERLSAIHALRIEHPFLDLDLARLITGLPAQSCWWPPMTKALLRHAMSGELPGPVLQRRDKTGFDAVIASAGIGSGASTMSDAAIALAARWREDWTFVESS